MISYFMGTYKTMRSGLPLESGSISLNHEVSVPKMGPIPVVIDGSSLNLPGVPGMSFSAETFYSAGLNAAVGQLTHEGAHDANSPVFANTTEHNVMRNVVPDVRGESGLPDNNNAFSIFYDFAANATLATTGESLWQVLLNRAGPKPVRP
jgi:hypothetical protein